MQEHAASINRVWRQLLGVEGVVVEGYDIDESEQALIVPVRQMKTVRVAGVVRIAVVAPLPTIKVVICVSGARWISVPRA